MTSPGNDARRRILDAAFAAFMEAGYAETSTLEIARRAKVSKRELYALVGTKQEMLVACIRERSTRLQAPAAMPRPDDRAALERVLAAVGAQLLRETTNETVIAVYRLAIAESTRTPEVAEALHALGRRSGRATVAAIMADARERGLLGGDPDEMAERFAALLWGDLMVGLLLRVVETPGATEVEGRASDAAATFLRLYPGT